MKQPETQLQATKADLTARLGSHPFLVRCRQGDVSLDELKLFLVQHGLYGRYFTRYLCALMANLESSADVAQLAENLCDELGLTRVGEIPHSELYRETLEYFDLTLDNAWPLAGTQRLIDTMFDHCRHHDPVRGLGALCLGAEALVPSMYSDIILAFKSHGVQAKALSFFHVHVGCDDAHAETMNAILVDILGRFPSRGRLALCAGDALVDARIAFFDSIQSVSSMARAT